MREAARAERQRARDVLGANGHGLPSDAVEYFVIDILRALDEDSARDSTTIVTAAMARITNGPTALAASEPILARRPFEPPASTVDEAASRIVTEFGERIISSVRRNPEILFLRDATAAAKLRAQLNRQRQG